MPRHLDTLTKKIYVPARRNSSRSLADRRTEISARQADLAGEIPDADASPGAVRWLPGPMGAGSGLDDGPMIRAAPDGPFRTVRSARKSGRRGWPRQEILCRPVSRDTDMSKDPAARFRGEAKIASSSD